MLGDRQGHCQLGHYRHKHQEALHRPHPFREAGVISPATFVQTRFSMEAWESLRNLQDRSFSIQGWVNKGWKGKAEEEWVTLRNRKLRTGDGEKLGLTVDLPKLFDQFCWLWDYQALSRLPRVDLVSDSEFRLDHYVAISPQGVDVTLYGGFAPHDVVDVGIEDYWFR
jgi:hypothetical protein